MLPGRCCRGGQNGAVPEGDSVYKEARRLEPALTGRTLTRGVLRVPAHATDNLAGHTVTGLDTHGKHLLTRFDSGLTLHTHLQDGRVMERHRSGQAAAP